MKKAIEIVITGIVQGVGFRPFVWRIAHEYGIAGSVKNSANGVVIHAEGREVSLDIFYQVLLAQHPPLAKISAITRTETTVIGAIDFTIDRSTAAGSHSVQISPDITVCKECRNELFNPVDRRFHYPFINCTNCGPRFTIIKDIPYDRAATSMAGFALCPECDAEYHDPSNRRYHAQPIACPRCGPAVYAQTPQGTALDGPWEHHWVECIRAGKIAAVKGIGGFHLACNCLNEPATRLLRSRKKRERKPFALMTDDLDWIRQVCSVSVHEERLLQSPESPIVILKIRNTFPGLEWIAPGLDTIGIMLPYSPMHLLMLNAVRVPLVMTSANYSREPMIHTNDEALAKLGAVADLFLMHNRDIVNRCEDSVAACSGRAPMLLRPGRGYAPYSIPAGSTKEVIAFGADMKNAFAISHDGRITVSPYIGDCEHPLTQKILLENIRHSINLYRLKPGLVVHDLHPDYFTTQLAQDFARSHALPTLAVQHHHAHCAAAYTENNCVGKAIGFAFDGTGYGTDGTIWGGEVFLFDLSECRRSFHFLPVPLPGGDKAVASPQRMLIAYLHTLGLLDRYAVPDDCQYLLEPVTRMIDAKLNCPLTSSAGRLFDAVAALCGFTGDQTYDGEAAMWLEACADADEQDVLPWNFRNTMIDCTALFDAILDQKQSGVSLAVIAGRFHNSIVDIIATCGKTLAETNGLLPWIFSGGVFQNRLLARKIRAREDLHPFRIYFGSCPNDSGIAVGQAAVSLTQCER